MARCFALFATTVTIVTAFPVAALPNLLSIYFKSQHEGIKNTKKHEEEQRTERRRVEARDCSD